MSNAAPRNTTFASSETDSVFSGSHSAFESSGSPTTFSTSGIDDSSCDRLGDYVILGLGGDAHCITSSLSSPWSGFDSASTQISTGASLAISLRVSTTESWSYSTPLPKPATSGLSTDSRRLASKTLGDFPATSTTTHGGTYSQSRSGDASFASLNTIHSANITKHSITRLATVKPSMKANSTVSLHSSPSSAIPVWNETWHETCYNKFPLDIDDTYWNNATIDTFSGNAKPPSQSAVDCACRLQHYSRSSSSWLSDDADIITYSTVFYNVTTSWGYTSTRCGPVTVPLTIYCDGIPRANQTCITSSSWTTETILYSNTSTRRRTGPLAFPPPPCTISDDDCVGLSASLESAVSRGFTNASEGVNFNCDSPCNLCRIDAAGARVLYWPPQTIVANNSCAFVQGHRTIIEATQTIPGKPNTAILDGHTLTSPSLYVSLSGVSANGGDCGTTYSTALISIPPGGLSSYNGDLGGFAHQAPGYVGGQVFNQADLSWPVPLSAVSALDRIMHISLLTYAIL